MAVQPDRTCRAERPGSRATTREVLPEKESGAGCDGGGCFPSLPSLLRFLRFDFVTAGEDSLLSSLLFSSLHSSNNNDNHTQRTNERSKRDKIESTYTTRQPPHTIASASTMAAEASSSSAGQKGALQKAEWENEPFPLGGARVPKGMEEHANWQDLPEVSVPPPSRAAAIGQRLSVAESPHSRHPAEALLNHPPLPSCCHMLTCFSIAAAAARSPVRPLLTILCLLLCFAPGGGCCNARRGHQPRICCN